ncbi:MAG: hypothetical protein ACXVHW_10570, partial [Methanobacterium sp.]
VENKEFKIELWGNWAKENFKLFKDLVDGATIAVSITEYNERIILLQKQNNGLKISAKEIKNFNEIENYADLMFIIDKKNVLKIFNDNSSSFFIDLLCSGEIEIYELSSKSKLIEKGYNVFLYGLGLKLEGICSCD